MGKRYFTKEDTDNKLVYKKMFNIGYHRKLQIKNTRYHYGQNQEHCQQHITTHWQGCGATGTHSPLMGTEKSRATLLDSLTVFFKIKLSTILFSSCVP